MSRTLYDLSAADGRRFSPYCWRAKLALAHKGLDAATVPVAFTEIPAILGGGQTTVPVLDDGGRIVRDSFAIAEYLEVPVRTGRRCSAARAGGARRG
jgi:hypothetical protein